MSSPASSNIQRHPGVVERRHRERLLGQRGCVVWLTGLSGSGKSTLARRVEELLHQQGHLTYVLDGDNVRHGLNSDLGFSARDREENIRRIGEVAALFGDAGLIVLVAFISPYRRDRARAREMVGAERFFEVHLCPPLAECERRDPKSLYARARAGEIPEFTGISAPYEPPDAPALALDTARLDLDECVGRVVSMLEAQGALAAP